MKELPTKRQARPSRTSFKISQNGEPIFALLPVSQTEFNSFLFSITYLRLLVNLFELKFTLNFVIYYEKRGNDMDVIEKIDRLRKERGWSVNYLAMEAMLTQSTLSNLYVRHTEPKLSTLRAICGAFGITLSEFFEEEGNGKDKRRADEEQEEERVRKVKALSPKAKEGLLLLLKDLPS